MTESAFSDAPAGEPVQLCPKPTHWIEIELLDEHDEPVPGEAYKIQLPTGDMNTGYLDDRGCARLEVPVTGTCQVSFPGIDGDDWQYIRSTPQSLQEAA
jgi:hypothetical protein